MDSKTDLKNDPQARLDALRSLLREGEASTQTELCDALKKEDFDVTQSTISRDLRRIGAVKAIDADGRTVYKLPEAAHIMTPVQASHTLSGHLIDIVSNESMIIIHTSPGSASLVARYIDSMRKHLEILGTIAGDDTVFIAPESSRKISSTIKKIKTEF